MNNETKKNIRLVGTVLFLGYLLLLIYFLFFAEWYGRKGDLHRTYSMNLELFKEIRRFWDYRDKLGAQAVFLNLGGNIIGFLPFGFILPIILRDTRGIFKITILGFTFSALVECLQLYLRVGSFDVDDMLLNTIGAMIGYLLFLLCNGIRKNIGKLGEKDG